MPHELNDLDPEFLSLVKKFLDELEARGIEYHIEWTHRNKLEQARLFSMGRVQEASGGFTRNRPGESLHNYGMAIDLHPVVNERVIQNHPDLQKSMGEIGQRPGLVWGGEFIPPEPQHFQMPDITIAGLKMRQTQNDKSA